jgi:probable HAF family extracellular repeat protein
MKTSRILRLALNTIFSLAALAVLPARGDAATPPMYSVTDMGPLIFGNVTNAVMGMSNSGLVLVNDDGRARLYWTNGTGVIRDLALDSRLPTACGFTAPLEVDGGGISHNGKVVVTAAQTEDFGFGSHCIAVLSHPGQSPGTWRFEQTLGFKDAATGVNDAGQVIGELDDGLVGFGPGCNFGQFPVPGFISADAINDSGQIAGTSDLGAELCTAGVWQVLPDFSGGDNLDASAINNKGEVVGDSIVSGVLHGFLYRAGNTVDLGANVFPDCINIHDEIVGSMSSTTTATGATSFLYQDGAVYDLFQLISPNDPYRRFFAIELSGIACINDHGVIVSTGTLGGGTQSHLFLLAPDTLK